jgi:hypothetical protein
MFREADVFTAIPAPHFSVRAVAPVIAAVPVAIDANAESAEEQINRLTWSVLDGSATHADRQRLAALVNSQHARRHQSSPP